MLFIFIPEFLIISVYLQTAFAAGTHRAEGQWLEDQQNMVKLCMFRLRALMPNIYKTHWQHMAPLQTFIKDKASV
jgi:hypothetical protein